MLIHSFSSAISVHQGMYNLTSVSRSSQLPPVINMSSLSLTGNMTGSSSYQQAEDIDTDEDSKSWLIHEFDNTTLIDNAPYVGLRKVKDSLAHYLLVCMQCCLLMMMS